MSKQQGIGRTTVHPFGWRVCLACLPLVCLLAPRAIGQRELAVQGRFFPLAEVTVRAEDEDGTPIRGAEVVAYSEYWRFSLPAGPEFAIADERGEVHLALPVGRWAFYAGSGKPYSNRHPGHAYFLSSDTLRIRGNQSVRLGATTTSNVALNGLDKEPFDAQEVYAMVPERIPRVSMPFCGRSEGGRLTLHTTDKTACRLLVVSRPAAGTGKGYVLLSAPVPVGRRSTVQAKARELSRLRLEARDQGGKPGWGEIHLVLPEIDLQRYWQWPCLGFRQADLYVTPSFARYFFRLDADQCNYWFRYRSRFLEAGGEYSDGVGGPLKTDFRASNDERSQKATNIWFRAEDAYGNILRFSRLPGKGELPLDIKLKQPDGRVVHREEWRNSNALCYRHQGTYRLGDQLECEAEWDLGAYGRIRLAGAVGDESRKFGWETIGGEHFTLSVARGSRRKGEQLLQRLEDSREFMAEYTGRDPPHLKVHLPILPAAAGQAGGDTILVFMGGFLDWTPADPVRGWERFLLHELGHHMIGRQGITGWRNEALASLLAFEAIGSSAGQASGDLWKTTEARPFLQQLADLPASPAGDMPSSDRFLVHIYLPRKCGSRVHREFFRRWPSHRKLLADFSEAEAFAAVYSLLAERNLAPLFSHPNDTVSTQRVAEALALLRAEGAGAPEPR